MLLKTIRGKGSLRINAKRVSPIHQLKPEKAIPQTRVPLEARPTFNLFYFVLQLQSSLKTPLRVTQSKALNDLNRIDEISL